MVMSFGTSTFASTKAESNKIEFTIPANLIIKQTVTFNDGKTITVYYQKEGSTCRMYSKTDVTKYKQSDLNRIKSTNFEVTDHIEGKCIVTKKTSDVISFAKSMLKQL